MTPMPYPGAGAESPAVGPVPGSDALDLISK
jgi:hypothetical protein